MRQKNLKYRYSETRPSFNQGETSSDICKKHDSVFHFRTVSNSDLKFFYTIRRIALRCHASNLKHRTIWIKTYCTAALYYQRSIFLAYDKATNAGSPRFSGIILAWNILMVFPLNLSNVLLNISRHEVVWYLYEPGVQNVFSLRKIFLKSILISIIKCAKHHATIYKSEFAVTILQCVLKSYVVGYLRMSSRKWTGAFENGKPKTLLFCTLTWDGFSFLVFADSYNDMRSTVFPSIKIAMV